MWGERERVKGCEGEREREKGREKEREREERDWGITFITKRYSGDLSQKPYSLTTYSGFNLLPYVSKKNK